MVYYIGASGRDEESSHGIPSTEEFLGNSSNDFTNLSLIIELTGEVFVNTSKEELGLVFSAYQVATLFPLAADSVREGYRVGSPVLGASVAGAVIANLSEPVTITFQVSPRILTTVSTV